MIDTYEATFQKQEHSISYIQILNFHIQILNFHIPIGFSLNIFYFHKSDEKGIGHKL